MKMANFFLKQNEAPVPGFSSCISLLESSKTDKLVKKSPIKHSVRFLDLYVSNFMSGSAVMHCTDG